jgi:uncharacterized protein with FMN-binding domain
MTTPSRRRRQAPSGRSSGPAKTLMALSGAVILSAYLVGYTRTEAAAQQASVSASAAGLASSAGAISGSAASTPAVSAPAAASGTASSTAKPPAWKDGTYTAQGWGPHGPVTVAVVIHGGRIESANVTVCGTTYSCAYITPLMREVVANQGPPTDYVSGATASSYAYYQAVTQALARA